MLDIDEQNLNNKKHESVHNRKNSSIISSLPTKIDFKQTILRNGPNNLSVLVLKSTEPSLSNVEIYRFKEVDRVFRTGWLYDEVIDSFFWNICSEHTDLLLCPTLVTTALATRHQAQVGIQRLWMEEDINSARVILAPWNPSRNHWVLVVIFLSSFAAHFLDPLSNHTELDDEIFVEAQAMFSFLAKNKFGEDVCLK